MTRLYVTSITRSVATKYYWVHIILVRYSPTVFIMVCLFVVCITRMYRQDAIRGAAARHRFD